MIERYGSAAQKDQYLRPIAANEQLSGLAVSEPETGSDLAGMSTEATKVDGGYGPSGEKYWVGNAVEADWLTLYAKTGDREDRYSNFSVFIVETDREGYHATHVPEKIGMCASRQGHIVLEDCFVPTDTLVGTEGGGFYMLAVFFNKGRVIVGGHGLGLAATVCAERAMQLHGGRSIFADRRISRVYRDVRIPTVYEGANEIQRTLIYRHRP